MCMFLVHDGGTPVNPQVAGTSALHILYTSKYTNIHEFIATHNTYTDFIDTPGYQRPIGSATEAGQRHSSYREVQPDSTDVGVDRADLVVARRRDGRGRRLDQVGAVVPS